MLRFQFDNNGKLVEVNCSYLQFIKYCEVNNKNITLDTTTYCDKSVSCEENIDKSKYTKLTVSLNNMHKSKKNKYFDQKSILPMPQILVNNPSISITPAIGPSTSSNKSSKLNSIKASQDPPITVLQLTRELSKNSNRVKDQTSKSKDKDLSIGTNTVQPVSPASPRTFKDSKENPKENPCSSKRTSTDPISNKPSKFQRLLNNSEEEIHNSEENPIIPISIDNNKNINVSSKNSPQISLSTSSPSSKSISTNRVPQELTNKQSTDTDFNWIVDPINDVEKVMVPNSCLSIDIKVKDENAKKKKVFSLETKTRMYQAVSKIIQEDLDSSESQNNGVLPTLPSKCNRSLESKDLKLNSTDHNNISPTIKNTNQVSNKSNKPKVANHHPSTSKQSMTPLQTSPINKQVSPTSSSSKTGGSPVKKNDKNDLRPQTSVNQLTTAFKHLTPPITHLTPPITQTQAQNKLIVTQQPSTSKHFVCSVTQLPSVTKQLISQPSGKPTLVCQAPHVQNIKSCLKCNSVLTEDVDCQTCHMSKLKGITVTRIGAIGTQQISDEKEKDKNKEVDKEKDTIQDQVKEKINDKDLILIKDKDKINIKDKDKIQIKDTDKIQIKDKVPIKTRDKIQNKVKDKIQIKDKDTSLLTDPTIVCIISSDDDDNDDDDDNNSVKPLKKSCSDKEEIKVKAVDPVVGRVELPELFKSHLDKLKFNPKLLEDKLWQKDMSARDFFKFEHSQTVCIGSFNTSPVDADGIFICLHGVRMAVHGPDKNPVTIDVLIENIVQISGYYGEPIPTIFIQTSHLAATGIRFLLKMEENKRIHNFDSLSRDEMVNKIMLTFELNNNEMKQLETLLWKLPKGKYKPLAKDDAIKMKEQSLMTDIMRKQGGLSKEDYESLQLTGGNLDGKQVTPVKICDYKMLEVDEFVNDAIVEFYLNYWYSRGLSPEEKMRTYVFDTFFYTSLAKKKLIVEVESKAKSRHNRVKKWTKKINIFEKDFIFIPINENYHWFMAVICYPHLTGPVHYENGTPLKSFKEDDFGDYDRPSPKPCDPNYDRDEADGNSEDFRYYPNFCYDVQSFGNYKTDVEKLKKKNRTPIKRPAILIFDSLNGHTSRARIVATLREWVAEEYRTKHNGAVRDFSSKTMKGTVVKVPQQPNYTDCGLFVMHYFQKFFECPIIDYTCPILHLENWFPIDDVSKNCKKRREVQSIVLNIMNEQGRKLPSGVPLPELNFISLKLDNHIKIPMQRLTQSSMQQYQQMHSQQSYYNNQVEDSMELDEDDGEELDDEEMYSYEETENGQYQEDHHGQYSYDGNEYQGDGEVSQDERHYYAQIDDPWSEGQQEGDYQSESDFDIEHSNRFNGNETAYHMGHTHRNHNHQNMVDNHSYDDNYEEDEDVEEEIDDDDEDELVDEEDEDDEEEEVDEEEDYEEEDSNDELINHPRDNTNFNRHGPSH